jgi:glutamate/tyrosine decarboxylase-like PLP-dependent enzyme
VPGVTSISADVHKYGYAIKGASVILHRPKANLRHQVYTFSDWPGGIYGTQAFQGTKPAPPIAAAWAVMQFLGEEGYVRLARETMDTTEKLIAGIEAIDGLHVWGKPDMTVLALGSRERDIFAVGDVLNQRAWHFDRQERPDSLHLMVSPRHSAVVEEFLEDLRFAAQHAPAKSETAATYGDIVAR